MNLISCQNIKKSFIDHVVLDKVSFTVNKNDKIGLVGVNGSGKTTLFKILSNNLYPDSGNIYINKEYKIGYLEQHAKITSNNTIYQECLSVFSDLIELEENLRQFEKKMSSPNVLNNEDELNKLMKSYGELLDYFNKKDGYGYKSKITGVLTGLGFLESDFNKKVDHLSGGQKTRLNLAKLLLENPDILLLDEPTNHLDIKAINWLENYLSEYKGAILIISHDRYFLDNIVNKIFHLNNKNIKIYKSNYTDFMKQRKKDLKVLNKQYENQQKEIKRQEEIIERFSNYGDKRYIKQAQSRKKLLDEMKKIKPPNETELSLLRFIPEIESGRDVLSVENLSKSYNNLSLFENLNFNIYKGEKVALIGDNGTGKSTILKIILGQVYPDKGEIKLGSNVKIGYFDQEMSDLNPNKTVLDELWDSYPKLKYFEVRRYLSQFLFIGDDILKLVANLSGGEKSRLSLLKLMLSNANFLVMDEPTNHLDIESKEVLEDALNKYEGTLLVVSHDRYFLTKSVNRIIELEDTKITNYLGNYEYYIKKKNELNSPVIIKEKKTKTQIENEKKEQKKLEKQKKKINKKISKLEENISILEKAIEEIDTELYNPDIYEDTKKVLSLNEKRNTLEEKLNKYYEKWMNSLE